MNKMQWMGVLDTQQLAQWNEFLKQLSLCSPSLKEKLAVPVCQCKEILNDQAKELDKVVHGVECSLCSQNIIGIRYKCTVCHNYDLCTSCEEKDMHDITHPRIKIRVPVSCASMADQSVSTDSLSAKFVQNMSYDNGSTIPPGKSFTKTWRVKNNGQVPWPPNTILVNVGGKFSTSDRVSVPSVNPGDSVDISVDMIAPSTSCRCLSYWQLQSGGEFFGNKLWMDIFVGIEPSHRIPIPADPALYGVLMKENSSRLHSKKFNKSVSLLQISKPTQNETESVSILNAMGFKGDVIPVLRQNKGDLMMTIRTLLK